MLGEECTHLLRKAQSALSKSSNSSGAASGKK